MSNEFGASFGTLSPGSAANLRHKNTLATLADMKSFRQGGSGSQSTFKREDLRDTKASSKKGEE